MELNKFHTINYIESSTFDWNNRVRLQSLWKGINRETKEFYGLNMIFIDDCNSRIHAFVSKQYCEDLLDKLHEGQIYILSNFKVKDFLGDEIYRPVRNKKHIYFTPHRRIEKDDTTGLEIEYYAFDLYYMEEIQKIADDNRFLIDMAGKVENIEGIVKTTKNNQETTRVKFEISDGRFSVKVTFFEEFGNTVEQSFQNLDTNDIYVIICCARVGRYEGLPNLTNYPATRIHINPNHYSIKQLKDNWHLNKSMSISCMEEELTIPKLTVKQIRQLKPDFDKKEVSCDVTVKKVEENSGWYYTKCTDCEIEIYRVNGIYKCSKCPRIFPYPDKRFRLCTVCSDNTGSIAIIFPDSEVSRITDTAVVDIHSECLTEKDEDKFPDILKLFLNQKYTITLEIKEENIKKGSTVFEAKEILSSMEISDSFDPTKDIRVESNDASIMKDMETDSTKNQTPQIGNSTNIKSKARKIVDPVEYNINDNEQINKLKNIKKEKKA